MELVRKNNEAAGRQRVAQAKFTSRSRENAFSKEIDESPAMVAQRKRLDGLFGGAIQRVEEEEPLQGKFETAQRVEDEEPLQGKFDAVQRAEEEEALQGKFETAQRMEEEEPLQGKFEAASSVQRKEEAAKPNDTGLPDNLKSGIESLSGVSMDNVKVHYNSPQPAQLNARAYAQGTDIHVAPGQEQHLPHEAWHVVQQAQGRVQPTMQMKAGVPVNNDKSLEHEADVMGARALQMRTEQAESIKTTNQHDSLQTKTATPIQKAVGEMLGSAYYFLKSLVWHLPVHVWRLIKHCTVGLGISIFTILYRFGHALYEGFHNGNWTAFLKDMAAALLGEPLVWAAKLLAKVLDLVAFGEAMDMFMTIFKWNTRGMNGAEIAACQTVFGNKINYAQVRVDEHSLLNTHVFHFWLAFTTWHTVNWPNGSSFATDPGTFIHEMAHIWQMDRRGTQYIAEAPYGGGLHGGGYVYAVDRNPWNPANGAALAAARGTGSTIWSYNLEQQAEICRHFYLRNVAGAPTGNWQPYIDDIQGINTMPLKTWLKEPAFLPWS